MRQLPQIKISATRSKIKRPSKTKQENTNELIEVISDQNKRAEIISEKDAEPIYERITREVLNSWQLEWAVLHPHLKPREYLEAKGLPVKRIDSIMSRYPTHEWEKIRNEFTLEAQKLMVKKHSELIVETSETHLKASNIGLAKAIEMLTKGIEMTRKDGSRYVAPIRSIDLLNCMSAIEKAQAIYRKAVGLTDKDGEGLKEFVEKLATGPTIHNTQINVNGVSAVAQQIEQLSYDDILAFIEHKREKLALAERNSNPTEDLPANPTEDPPEGNASLDIEE